MNVCPICEAKLVAWLENQTGIVVPSQLPYVVAGQRMFLYCVYTDGVIFNPGQVVTEAFYENRAHMEILD